MLVAELVALVLTADLTRQPACEPGISVIEQQPTAGQTWAARHSIAVLPDTEMSTSAAYVLSKYRELLRLIQRLPSADVPKSLSQARSTIRERRHEQDPTKVLEYQKELAARISFLRITAPRQPGTPLEGGKYVFRNGEWVQGDGESKGSR